MSSSTSRKMYFEEFSYRSNTCKEFSWYQSFYRFVHRIYLQFLLITTLYVMEPWERLLVMGVFFLSISLISYSALVFIPYHLQHIFQWMLSSLSNTSMR